MIKTISFFLLFINFFIFPYSVFSATRAEESGESLVEDPIVGLFYRSDRSQHTVDTKVFMERNKPNSSSSTRISFKGKCRKRKVASGGQDKRPTSGRRLAPAFDDEGMIGFSGDMRTRVAAAELLNPPMEAHREGLKAQGHVMSKASGKEDEIADLVPEHFVLGGDYAHVEDTGASFYPKVVKMEMELLDDKDVVVRTYLGSGVMISDRHVLTAAHNLYYRPYKTGPSVVRVFPGRSGDHVPHEADALSFVVHPAYVLTEGEDYKEFDLGLVVLDEPLGAQTGHLPYQTLAGEALIDQLLHVVGYPATIHEPVVEDRPRFRHLTGYDMYQMSGRGHKLTERQLSYFIDTYGGHSGAPVIKQIREGEWVVCAIHTYGGTREQGNCGTWLSPQMVEYIERWQEEFTGEEEEEEEE